MKIKLLLVSAIAIVGMAVYTLTLSFTNTTPLLSQLEALASGEGGESGGDGSESGNTGGENPESGGVKYELVIEWIYCEIYQWERVPDGNGGYIWQKVFVRMEYVSIQICISVTGNDYGLDTCTPYNPCDPVKPTE